MIKNKKPLPAAKRLILAIDRGFVLMITPNAPVVMPARGLSGIRTLQRIKKQRSLSVLADAWINPLTAHQYLLLSGFRNFRIDFIQ